MNGDHASDKLLASVHRRRRRAISADRELTVPRQLARIGVLGWIVVTPTLLGFFGGRWLDRTLLGGGMQLSLGLLFLGLVLGCWSAWRWIIED